jgi:hypothetical protein
MRSGAGVSSKRRSAWGFALWHPRITVLVALAASLLLIGTDAAAADLFVAQGASGGDGSEAAPYGTIAEALAVASSGTTIHIGAGSYPESIFLNGRQNLTFVGAGMDTTHLVGSGDAFVAQQSSNITLRDLHVASPTGRGIIAQAASLTLDRVSTVGNRSYNVLGVGYLGTNTTLVIQNSKLDQSQVGNGLRLEGGVTATVQDSTIDANGTAPGITSISGRGVEMFVDSVLTLERTSVSDNFFGGVLLTQTARATIRESSIVRNGHNGIAFNASSWGDIHDNDITLNGMRGTRGPTTGFNGIEIQDGWSGPAMNIHDNTIASNTTNGIYIGGGGSQVTVANNYLYNNFVGLSVWQQGQVVVRGNTFELPIPQGNEEGIYMGGAGVSVTIGGSTPAQRNTFTNYIGNPALHCDPVGGQPTTVCADAWNVFQNCDLPNIGCTCWADPGPTFVDVSSSHQFFSWIESLVDAGITAGCSASPPLYCPNAAVTRDQMAVFLLRGIHGAGYQPPAATGMTFTDVSTSTPFASWIEQFSREGITAGCTASPPQFCPGGGVTRAHMAVFLLRAKHGATYLPPDATGMFADVPVTHPFADWIEQLWREGVTGGCGTSPLRYCPEDPVTRGQMAVFLVRTFQLPL